MIFRRGIDAPKDKHAKEDEEDERADVVRDARGEEAQEEIPEPVYQMISIFRGLSVNPLTRRTPQRNRLRPHPQRERLAQIHPRHRPPKHREAQHMQHRHRNHHLAAHLLRLR